ncbi:MAG: sulfotransferase [Nitrospinae bacterium]|nr:sulfotransferase [Nitrospinota bacterium]
MNRSEKRRQHKLALKAAKKGSPDQPTSLDKRQSFNIQQAIEVAIQHHSKGDLPKAEAIYQQILQIDPNQPAALHLLGVIAHQVGKNDLAFDLLTKTITIKPSYAEAYKDLGLVLQDLGEKDKAVASYHKAIGIKPDLSEAHRLLAQIKKHSEYDDDIQAMEQAYSKPAISVQDTMHLAFGLGKAFEDLHQYKKAFCFFAKGNSIKRQDYNYSINDQELFFKKLEETFDTSLFVKHLGTGSGDKTPIFILGMPRSGTTLVEQILASHPHVHGAGELVILGQAVQSFISNSNNIDFQNSFRKAEGRVFTNLGTKYVNNIRLHSKDAAFITDKLPENFRYIGIIKLILPNARVIHCRRNPMDTCFSIFKHLFSQGHEYSYDLEILGKYYNLYRNLMKHWHNVLPGFIYDINYEDLVADQALETRALLKYCGLDWDDACLEFYRTKRQVRTASSEQVRRPIYKDSIQLWKKYENQLAPLIEELKVG